VIAITRKRDERVVNRNVLLCGVAFVSFTPGFDPVKKDEAFIGNNTAVITGYGPSAFP